MPESPVNPVRRPRRHAGLRTAAFALLGLASMEAAAAPLKLYLYRDNGMPVYTNREPENVEYTIVYPGSGAARPVLSTPPPAATPAALAAAQAVEAESEQTLVGWAASCKGVTEAMMAERASRLQDMVARHSRAHGVPAELVRAVMRVESCFDVRAVSRVGARGLMQLMPATAAELGVRDSFDPDQNIAGGVRYLSHLLGRFKNDLRLAVAAYNAGPTAVDTHRGIPPFPETRSYVERVIAEYRGNAGASPKKKALS